MPLKMPRGTLSILDLYGHPIGVNLHGESVYRTKLGSFVSLLTYALILFNLVKLLSDFRSKDNQIDSYQQIKQINSGRNISLGDHQIELAFTYNKEALQEFSIDDLIQIHRFDVKYPESSRASKSLLFKDCTNEYKADLPLSKR